MGFTNGGAIGGVHSNLNTQAVALGGCVEQFGTACEGLLIKHGKGIVDHQFELNRIANAAIDLYTSATVLSRASRAIERSYDTAAHEEKLARVWVNEVRDWYSARFYNHYYYLPYLVIFYEFILWVCLLSGTLIKISIARK